ncbi:hypothetical protein [Cupriavidus sp. SS-3]|uniref:hypothetical protein n=1 Tax=Cupriavidus sp. SS-3 TaxID=3109596 RepID=UPI002DBD1756|nr:hypothetical protein [Cupriavidus sp. SS-3]MEC3769050.1 hypothetical protein [Cupriavidus sp. SS-3]
MEPKINKWKPAPSLWMQFTQQQHPELNMSGTLDSWFHFNTRHGPRLRELDILRKVPGNRGTIADSERFEQAAFELLTRGTVEDDREPTPASAPRADRQAA